jgi:hypothetical protein
MKYGFNKYMGLFVPLYGHFVPALNGNKFVAAQLQTRMFTAPHKKEDKAHLQVHQVTF